METFKYAVVWQRVRMKLKTRRTLESLRKDLNLFGGTREVVVKESGKRLSEVRVWWEAIILFCILYGATVLPFRSAFQESSAAWTWSDLALSLLFTCDFFLCLRRGRYLASALDALACIPIQVLGWLQLAKMYRLLTLARVLKLSLFPSEQELCSRVKNLLRLSQTQLQLTLCLLAICTCIHVVTCAFYLTAQLESFSPETWVVRAGQQDRSPGSLYVAALYWAVTTFATVGYGDIACRTTSERLLGLCWMVSSVFFFSFTLSSLTSLFMSVETKQNVLLEKLSLINEFAKEARLTPNITRKLAEAIRYTSSQALFSWSSNQELFQELPKGLRYQVALAMHRGAAKDLPFFSEHSREFLASTVPFLQNLHRPISDVITREQDYADEILFLTHGRINYTLQQFVYKTLHKGCYFGDIEVLRQIPRKYTTVAATGCGLLVMRKELLEGIRGSFPGIWMEMVEVAKVREEMCDKARAEATGYLKILKTGRISLKPEELRAQLAELKEQRETPTLDWLSERLQFCQTRCESLQTGLRQVRVNLQVLRELITH